MCDLNTKSEGMIFLFPRQGLQVVDLQAGMGLPSPLLCPRITAGWIGSAGQRLRQAQQRLRRCCQSGRPCSITLFFTGQTPAQVPHEVQAPETENFLSISCTFFENGPENPILIRVDKGASPGGTAAPFPVMPAIPARRAPAAAKIRSRASPV